MTQLGDYVAPAVQGAVDQALHDTDPDRFHERLPPGPCPLCPSVWSRAQEMLESTSKVLRERGRALMELQAEEEMTE